MRSYFTALWVAVVVAATSVMSLSAQESSQLTRFLVPLYGNTTGIGGARWATELLYFNGSSSSVSPLPQACEVPVECGGFAFGSRQEGVVSFLPRVGTVSPGRLIYVPTAVANLTFMDARLYAPRDITPGVFERAGTEIPVIREDAALTSPAYLLGVRLNATQRLMLRLYDVDARPVSLVEVRFLSAGQLIASQVVPLVGAGPVLGGLSAEPGYAQIADLRTTFPALQTLLRATIEVVPLTPGLRFYALLSSTDAATNDVSIYTPMPAYRTSAR